MALNEGIIKDVRQIKIGVVGIGQGAGATLVSAVVAHEISKCSGLTYYIGEASKEELGLSKKLERGHVRDNIFWARGWNDNFNGYAIFDSPSEWNEMDCVIAVLDPLPSRMLKNLETYKMLLKHENEKREKVFWMINKMNDGINIKETERFFKKHFEYVQPMAPYEKIYRDQYRGEPIYFNENFQEIRRLAQDIVEFL